MNVALICFPGTNRDADVYRALAYVTGCIPHVVWYKETELPRGIDLVILPGGFAHGDYGGPGVQAVQAPIMTSVCAHGARGGFILGLCNGFQMLCEAGLLPGRLEKNTSGIFVHRHQWVRVERSDTCFSCFYKKGEVLKWPIAHGYGNYQCNSRTLEEIVASDGIAFRYCTRAGDVVAKGNPNGSVQSIAGLYDRSTRILGLMPHPENAVDGFLSSVDGRRLFLSLCTNVRDKS